MEEKISKETKKEIKKRWSAQYMQLSKIINEWDPLDVICIGAPKDEYDCLTTQLLSLLYSGKQLEEITGFVFTELNNHFGISITDIREEFRDKFIWRVNRFCSDVFNWFIEYEQKSRSN